MIHELAAAEYDKVKALYEPLTFLNRAIDSGWDYAPDLESTEFDALRGTPEWQALVRRLGD